MKALTFNASQRITSSTGAISTVVGGLPFSASGELIVTDGTLAPSGESVNGWPMESTGKVAIHVGGTKTQTQNGLPLTATGRLATDNTNAVAGFSNGLPYTADGLSIA